MDILYIAAVVAIALVGQALLFSRLGLRGVTYRRSFSKEAAFAGETVEMVEVIRNKKMLPVPWIRVEARMSTHLRFAAQADADGLHETSEDALHHRSVFLLSPYSQVTRRHAVKLLARGHYRVGTVALTAGDLLGIAADTAQLDTGAAISVYPRLLPDAEMPAHFTRWQGELAVKRWIVPDPFLVAGIREWQAGDARRDVHWAATARTGRLQVKAHDYTASPKLMVILNVQMQEGQWADLMDYEQVAIEHGISMAATYCMRALQAGLEAGFAANAPSGAEQQPAVYPPAHNAGRDADLLDILARLRIRRTNSFQSFLESLCHLQGMDMLILSAYDSPLLQEKLAMLRQRGNTVSLCLLPGEVAA